MTARRVLLWRHGRTAWNVEHRFQGQADPPLDEVGRAQSAAAAPLLAAFAPVAIVSSDLRRAVDTARPLAELLGLPIVLDPRLRERSLGRWEGLTRDEVGRLHPMEYADWLAGREDCQTGSEPRADLGDRALAALAAAAGETVVLVTHSATAMALTGRLLGLPVSAWRAVGPLANCHWSELRSDEHGWRLRAHNVGPIGGVVPMPVARRAAADAETEALDAGPPDARDAPAVGVAALDAGAAGARAAVVAPASAAFLGGGPGAAPSLGAGPSGPLTR